MKRLTLEGDERAYLYGEMERLTELHEFTPDMVGKALVALKHMLDPPLKWVDETLSKILKRQVCGIHIQYDVKTGKMLGIILTAENFEHVVPILETALARLKEAKAKEEN